MERFVRWPPSRAYGTERRTPAPCGHTGKEIIMDISKGILQLIILAVVVGFAFGDKDRFLSLLGWTAVISAFMWSC